MRDALRKLAELRAFLRRQAGIWQILAGVGLLILCWDKGWQLFAKLAHASLLSLAGFGAVFFALVFVDHLVHVIETLWHSARTFSEDLSNDRIEAWPAALLLAFGGVVAMLTAITLVFG